MSGWARRVNSLPAGGVVPIGIERNEMGSISMCGRWEELGRGSSAEMRLGKAQHGGVSPTHHDAARLSRHHLIPLGSRHVLVGVVGLSSYP